MSAYFWSNTRARPRDVSRKLLKNPKFETAHSDSIEEEVGLTGGYR